MAAKYTGQSPNTYYNLAKCSDLSISQPDFLSSYLSSTSHLPLTPMPPPLAPPMIPKLLPISPRASSSEPLILLTMHSAPCTKNYAPATKYQELGIHEVPSTMHHASLIKPILPPPLCITYTLCTLLFALCQLLIHDAMCYALKYSKCSEKVQVIKIKKAFLEDLFL